MNSLCSELGHKNHALRSCSGKSEILLMTDLFIYWQEGSELDTEVLEKESPLQVEGPWELEP